MTGVIKTRLYLNSFLRAVDEELVVRGAALVLKAAKPSRMKRKLARGDRRREKLVAKFRAVLHTVLDKAERETLANLRRTGVQRGGDPALTLKSTLIKAADPVAGDFLFRVVDFAHDFLFGMRQAHEQAVPETARGILADLGVDQQLATPKGLVERFLIQRENKLKDVPNEIYEQIKGQLEQGAMEGESIDHMADRIRDAFDQVYEGRAEVVARTEAHSAYGLASHESMKQAGFTHKKWSATPDNRTRDAHDDLDGQVVPVDEPFTATNEKGEEDEIMYPGDPEAEPWNSINCRCQLLAATEDEET